MKNWKMNKEIREEAKIYRRQIIEMGENSKKTLTLEAAEVMKRSDDEELGRWVREMLEKKIEEIDNHINYIKSLDNGSH
jgi:hypothetical protein